MSDVSSITIYAVDHDGTERELRTVGPDMSTAKFHVESLRRSGQYRTVGYRLNRYGR